MKEHRWEFAECDRTLAAQFERELGLPSLLAQCVLNRGCANLSAAAEYLQPKLARLSDPYLLPDMERAVERLMRAHQEQESFVIFGDYDVDGVTSTALLSEFFGTLGWRTSYYLPHRLEEGYGLTRDAVENCLERFKVRLLLAVDCGSTSTELIAELKERAIDVIVLDHHQVSSPAPPALALVNPQRLTAHGHLKALCSAGLAFKLAHAVLKRCRSLGWPPAHQCDLRQFLDLVALGTIADLVPLQGENRIFASAGLDRLGKCMRPGLRALKEVAGIGSEVSTHEVAFQLAPRLNAAGRLETALAALELLLTSDAELARSLAKALDEQNRQRQAIEQEIVDQALSALRARFNPLTDFAIVEGAQEWHLGVVGIVASRVLREFHRPAIILGGNGPSEWRGSGRSIEGFDLAAGLRGCADLLLKHGGHAMAAGLSLIPGKVGDFRTRLNELVKSSVGAESLQPKLRIDAEVQLADLTFSTLKRFGELEPFGQGNPPIQLAARNLQLRGEPKAVGSSQQHLRFSVSDGGTIVQALWWNCEKGFVFPSSFDLAFAPELNEYNGTFGIQLKVLDLKPAAARAKSLAAAPALAAVPTA